MTEIVINENVYTALNSKKAEELFLNRKIFFTSSNKLL
jgi:hypothetical protein